MLRFARLIAFSMAFLLTPILNASPVAIDAKTFEGISVGRHLLLLEDKDGQLQHEDVAKLPDSAFFAVDEEVPNLKFSQSAYWARLTLDNELPRAVPLIFEFGYPVVDSIDFYSMDEQGQWIRLDAGDRRPISGRRIAHRLAAFPFDLPSGLSSVLIRVQTQGVVQFPVKLWTPLAFHNHRVFETGFLLFILGILTVMIFYNLFVGIKTRSGTSLIYVAYLVNVVIFYSGGQTGLLSLLGSDSITPPLMNNGYLLAMSGAAIFGVLLCQRFLEVGRSSRFLYSSMVTFIVLSIAASMTSLVDYNAGSKFTVVTVSGSTLIVVYTSALRSLQRYRPAYFFGLAWTSVIIGILIYVTALIGIVPTHPFSYFAPSMGMAIEVVLISLAIGDKMHIAQLQSEQQIRELNESLEIKVEEKTQHIRSIMTHIPLGIFAIADGHCRIHKDYSDHLHDLFELDDLTDLNACDVLFERSHRNSDEKNQAVSVVAASLGENPLVFEMNAHALPAEIRRRRSSGEERILDLTWNPIVGAEDQVDKILVTLRDVTEVRALREDAQDKQEELQFIGELINVPNERFTRFIHSCRDFIAENRKLINSPSIAEGDMEVLKVLFINMHTMKGAARSLYFKKMTRIFHDVEQYYALLQKDPGAKWDIAHMNRDINEVESIVNTYLHINHQKLGRKSDEESSIELAESQLLDIYHKLLTVSVRIKHVLDDKTHQILRDLRIWIFPKIFASANDILADISLCLAGLAKDLDKVKPDLVVSAPDIFLNRKGEELLRKIFVHILRNSMDHGIETAAERLAAGKLEKGTISMTMKRCPGGMSLIYQDDGRGLNIERIKQKAEHHKMIEAGQVMTTEAAAELIFCSGLSTAGRVSDISGRGVGMDAVRKFLLAADGNIRVHLLHPERHDTSLHPFYFEIHLADALFANSGEELRLEVA